MAKQKKKSPTKSKKRAAPQKKKTSFLWRLTKWTLVLGIWGSIFIASALLWFAQSLPDITQAATFERRSLIVINASDGTTLARYGESKGENIRAQKLPKHLVHAILAIEDRRFYDHPGIDILGIARALASNIMHGGYRQGGSTITQQLAKNLFLTHERKITRKAKEALLALWLERELTKDEILSAYMNRVYLGSGTYGFDAAARLYFGKSAYEVNLLESAVLAGLLKAPSRYSPHNNPALAKERGNTVLSSMEDAGFIASEEASYAKSQKLSLPHKQNSSGQNTRYFTDWIIEGLDDLIGNADMDIYVETTLNSSLQELAQTTLQNAIDKEHEMNFVSQGAILSMAPNGAILAMVGGRDYGQSQFNRTTLSRRPPGSSFKPFIYLGAIEKGWDGNDKILDAPITEGEYKPKNFADRYMGEVTLETALSKSLNTAAVRLAQDIGMSQIMSTTRRLGIISPLNRDLSIALGSSGVSMLELTTAYSIIANGGKRVFPYAITKITNHNGDIIYTRKAPKQYQAVFKEKHIKELTSMMNTVINEGTGRGAKLPFPAAGKTGTSQDSRDAWFAGFSDKMVSVVWLGNDDNSPMRNVTGGGLPARIWKDIMLHGQSNVSTVNMPSTSENNDGISGLLGRLLSSDEWQPRETKKRGDFSNLND